MFGFMQEYLKTLAGDPVLSRFRAAVYALYGARIHSVVLYGSRARGQAGPESDYDIIVFLNDFTLRERHQEIKRLSQITADIITETGELVSALPYPAESYQARTPFMHEIRRDAVYVP